MKQLLVLAALALAGCTATVVPAPINLVPPPVAVVTPAPDVVVAPPVVVGPPVVVYRGYHGGWRR